MYNYLYIKLHKKQRKIKNTLIRTLIVVCETELYIEERFKIFKYEQMRNLKKPANIFITERHILKQ